MGNCPVAVIRLRLGLRRRDSWLHERNWHRRWRGKTIAAATAISDGLRVLHAEGRLAPDIDPDDLAVTLLATVQGGLLLA
jgi:hypothetical protein